MINIFGKLKTKIYECCIPFELIKYDKFPREEIQLKRAL